MMIRNFTSLIVNKIPIAEGIDSQGPFDIELGIKDKKIWLFQIRPFIENKKAVSSTYLMKINPEIPLKKKINILGKI